MLSPLSATFRAMNPSLTRLRDRKGTVWAALLCLIGLTGVALGIIGATLGHMGMSDSGIAVATLAALSGWSMRCGYNMAMHKRQTRDSREIDSQLAAMDDIHEQIQEAAAQAHGNVRRFPSTR